MRKEDVYEKLREIGQQHLLAYFDTLSIENQRNFLQQVEALHIPTLRQQQQLLLNKPALSGQFSPFLDVAHAGNAENVELGKQLLSEGRAGCLLIAGGQGTRLRYDGPKGCYPVSLIRKKSLFQLFAEKVAAAGKQVGRKLPLAIMTSPLNHERTLAFFSKNQNFGLETGQLFFFCQKMLPCLDDRGNLFLEKPYQLAMAPDGNGLSLKRFVHEGIWKQWYDQGIRYLTSVLVDNPLADPFDAELIGFHHRRRAQVVAKCTWRDDPDEKVGVLLRRDNQVNVIEYSELPEEERKQTLENGTLKYACANLSLFSFHMDFVEKIANLESLPLHVARKSISCLTSQKDTVQPRTPNAYAFEFFIFDVLPHASKVEALLYPRRQCFSPLKSIEGDASIETVQRDLQERDRQIISEITGTATPNEAFELSQDFYYPTEELLQRWRGRSLAKGGYITSR